MSTFADPRVLELLEKHFVLVAQDCDFTDRRVSDDPLHLFYRHVVEQRDPQKFVGAAPTPTQGYYVLDARGKLFDALSFNFVEGTEEPAVVVRRRSVHRLRAMLEAAVKDFRPSSGPVPAGLDKASLITYPTLPPGTVVLRSWSRVKPLPEGAHEMNTMVGRDFLWVRADEVAALAAERFPETLARRLVLGNLRDNVRGMPRTFGPEAIESVAFTARKTPQGIRLGGRFRVEGPASSKQPEGEQMGVEGSIEGLLVLGEGGTPASWWIYADLTCWGAYPNTPNTPEGRYPLKVGLVLAEAGDRLAMTLPPLAATGDVARYLSEGVASRRGGLD